LERFDQTLSGLWGAALVQWWVKMVERCPSWNLHFERVEGHWVGAVGMNTIFSFVLLFLGLAIFFFITYPDIPMGGWVFLFAGGYGLMNLFSSNQLRELCA
tara:strand:- start:716 stop:1018 length:303 start_codon:yes stop_codon:yes gene_type:complete